MSNISYLIKEIFSETIILVCFETSNHLWTCFNKTTLLAGWDANSGNTWTRQNIRVSSDSEMK